MGRWDMSKKSEDRNKKIQEYFLRLNSIIYKITPKFLLKIDYLIQKKVQRYVKIVSPMQYLTCVISLLVCSFLISNSDVPTELGSTIQIMILIVVLLLRASFSGGGGHKKKKNIECC